MLKQYHSEIDLLPFVIIACREGHGEATFEEIKMYIKDNVGLTPLDEEVFHYTKTSFPRWHQILRNLKSHKTLEIYGLAKPIPNGFCLTQEGEHISGNVF